MEGRVEVEGEGGRVREVVGDSCSRRVEFLPFLIFALRATTKPNTTAARLRRLKRRGGTLIEDYLLGRFPSLAFS